MQSNKNRIELVPYIVSKKDLAQYSGKNTRVQCLGKVYKSQRDSIELEVDGETINVKISKLAHGRTGLDYTLNSFVLVWGTVQSLGDIQYIEADIINATIKTNANGNLLENTKFDSELYWSAIRLSKTSPVAAKYLPSYG